jgi:hypothetical protein
MEREEEIITGGTFIERGWIHKIKLGLPVPGAKIVERRGKGLQAIRRYLLACLRQIDSEKLDSSLVVRWTRQAEWFNSRTVLDEDFELDLVWGADQFTTEFPDLWILCYPDDRQINQKVEDQIKQLCQEIATSTAS